MVCPEQLAVIKIDARRDKAAHMAAFRAWHTPTPTVAGRKTATTSPTRRATMSLSSGGPRGCLGRRGEGELWRAYLHHLRSGHPCETPGVRYCLVCRIGHTAGGSQPVVIPRRCLRDTPSAGCLAFDTRPPQRVGDPYLQSRNGRPHGCAPALSSLCRNGGSLHCCLLPHGLPPVGSGWSDTGGAGGEASKLAPPAVSRVPSAHRRMRPRPVDKMGRADPGSAL